MKIKKYQKLYSLPVHELELLNDDTKNSFIFQGSKNWDMYFTNKILLKNSSSFNNVILLGFTCKKKFEQYLSKNKIIDYSIEHIYEKNNNKYFVLQNNK